MTIIAEAYEALKPHLITQSMQGYNENRAHYLSSGGLGVARTKSLADFQYQRENPTDSDTAAFLEGRAIHVLVLEGPVKYLDEFHIGGPTNNKNKEFGIDTEKFREARKQCREQKNKELITTGINNRAQKIKEACHAHPVMADILLVGQFEKVVRTKYLGVDCQVRMDWISPVYGICDLKTCADLTKFERHAKYNFGYYNQAAFYRSIIKNVIPEFGDLPFSFLAVEKEPPYKAGVFMMDEHLLDVYEKANQILIEELAHAQNTGVWSTGFEELKIIQ